MLSGELERFTENTIVDPAALREELDEVVGNGFATTIEEFEEGLNAAAAPIRDAEGTVVATIGVSGPSYRLDADELRKLAPGIREAADLASSRMGYFHPVSSDD
ncbi:MAG: hypothetical protein GEV00_00965 [Actinophytocola sp.]|nr:hypothetical protein [Actinophytocola sp.]